ncbi:androglobin [Limosa lapponica baueri]|uniref:Androglobin n=1 Tax=Limosa lapponica baueri TaxID=1758121 RepID=A0A2I0TXK5_LIMLA|nr:androglobin [Limosa lapponica baueri]
MVKFFFFYGPSLTEKYIISSLLEGEASKSQIIQSSTKKESETRGSKKKGVSSSKDTKASFKPERVQEGPPILEDESSLLENFQNNGGSPQQSHKYVIQALVLYNSWPLTESQSLFVQALKEMEKNEIKGQKSASIPKPTKKSKDKASEKTEKEKSNKERGSLISLAYRPESQQAASNKPYWTLRLVSEQREADILEAFQERMRFINKYAVRDSEEPIAGSETASLTSSSVEGVKTEPVKNEPELKQGM